MKKISISQIVFGTRAMTLVLAFFISNISFCQIMDIHNLEDSITKRFKGVNGDFALAFKNLSGSNEMILINPDEPYHAASTMKTAVMIEIFNQVAEGKLSFKDSILIKNDFKSIVDGSSFSLEIDRDGGEKLYHSIGKRTTLEALVYDMIIHSSNLATNILMEIIDAKNITGTMRTLGADNIQIYRGVEDMKAFEKGLNNSTTARDLLVIFDKLASGSLINKKANQDMVRILMDQKDKTVIPAKLPADIKVAHKTGNITGVYHDSGIVYLPDGKHYVLIMLSKNLDNTSQGVEMMADVSKLIYDYVWGF